MTHKTLLKHGWLLVFSSTNLDVYEDRNGVQYYRWSSGKEKVIKC